VTPGIANEYSSTCQECAAGCGLRVTTREARPIKLEGNPDHPINKGRLCGRGQAAIARTYHPDRYERPMIKGSGGLEATTWDRAQSELVGKLKSSAGKTWVLGGDRGETLNGLIDGFVSAVGAAGRVVYEPFAYDALRNATKAVFGVSALPIFDVSAADLVIDFGSDFMDTWLSPVEHSAQIADARDVSQHPDGGTEVVSVGPRLNLTGGNSDHWVPAKAGSEGVLALALADAVIRAGGGGFSALPGSVAAAQRAIGKADIAQAAANAGISQEDLDGLVKRLLASKRPLVLPPGITGTSDKATSATAAVLLLDAVVGALGNGLRVPAFPQKGPASMAEVQKLIAAMNAGQVDVLLIHDANPRYSLPASSGFAEALEKVGTVVSFASLSDETSQAADLVLPDHTPLESWGDANPRDGVRSLVQPTVRPLWNTQSLGDTLLALGRALGASMPEGSFRSVLEAAWAGTNFREALDRGGVFTDAAAAAPSIGGGVDRLDFSAPTLEGSGDYTLVAYPHSFLGDGRSAALPWMQETPDPVTKATWESWAELSFATAEKLGVDFGDVVSIATDAGTIEVSVLPRGGIRDDVVAVAIGQGHSVGQYASRANDGMEGVARGVSVISVLSSKTDEAGGRVWLGNKASVSGTGAFSRIPLSQWSDNQRGRGLAPVVPLADLGKGDAHDEAPVAEEHAEAGHGEEQGGDHGKAGGHELLLPFETAYDADPESPYRWSMAIDTDRCNGCSACVAACSIENNIPVIGQDGSTRHREMTWIRIERYNGDGDREGGSDRRPYPNREKYGETDVRTVPMLCQHCGAAPCEAVCPTLATYHSTEGINGMIYNRCIGTRYCANNCTYKVRRFNYFDYSREVWPGLLGLMLNPDVTVRGQGVMEKCTFCVQRIETARQPAKDAGRNIADGEVQTACQQTCPTGAITFGNARDDQSQVVKKADDPARAFHSLHVLNTRPAITYLAKVTRETEGSH
jgi:Fe-S-cluster-containing dehydrogenase component/anaerobic selenocysteine-containing dehydrogenase